MITDLYLQTTIENAIKEDVGEGDHSSLACVPNDRIGSARIIAKEDGVICGINVATAVFKFCDDSVSVKSYKNDGDEIRTGDVILEIKGLSINILKAERTALNFMQRMSGIATETNKYAKKIQQYKAVLIDTRKTTPGLRLIEKYAVNKGGGTNHRMGLYDMIMLKDNHIDYAGGIEKAIKRTRKYLSDNNKHLEIVIEVRDFNELEQVMSCGGVDRIMLDNFNVDDTRKAVMMIDGKFEIESSGGITITNIEDYAKTGVDYISVGAVTHRIKSLDLSLKAI